ncbi:G2/mitotic-specific cyclin-B3 isoform X2 [Talpa occidentalis]|uniref:G2/mitotic-specific cyclin-B3 isoform X2 n=1 Tax=Talpa occidentalis TaxID=50954 RepID=UPI0023F980C2|nr:G2/mitotic-specific cyclin-B3 isoform X2 [Talpa occidentalis]
MPLPLPPRSTKSETKKSQSTKIRPSDHGHTEKNGENYQAKISPRSPHGALKKRSAFEDLTNAAQSHSVQPKKEANKEFVKGVSKKINRNSLALGLAKNNEMSMKRCKLEPSPESMVPNKEKPLTPAISAISETPMTEELSFSKKPLVSKEEFTAEETALIKRLLPLKKCVNPGEVPLSEKPLSLLKETDHVGTSVLDSVTFGKKHKTEEAAMTKSTLPLNKMCTYQGKQSCQGEELALQDISVQEDPVFMEPVTFRKKPKMEKTSPTKTLLSLKKPKMKKISPIKTFLSLKKCVTQGKMIYVKKPLVLQKATSKDKSLIKEPLSFERKPTTEKSLSQEPLMVQEMHTNQGEVPLLKKPGALQGMSIDTEDESPVVPVSFEEKRTTSESVSTKEQLSLKKKCATQVMMSVCQELSDRFGKDKDSHFVEPASFRKKSSTEEAALTKALSLKKEITQGKIFYLEKTASEEKSLCDKLLHFKKKPTTEEEFVLQDLSVLKEEHTTLQEVSLLKKPLILQEETTTKEESFIKEPLTLEEKPTTKEDIHFQESFSLPVKPANEDKSLFWMGLGLQKIDTEEVSVEKLLALQEKSTTEEESLCKKLLVLKEELSAEEAENRERQLSFEKKPTSPEEEKREALQEIIANEEESHIKHPLTLQEKPGPEKGALFKESLALKVKPSIKQKTDLKEPLGRQKEVSSEKETFREPWTLQEKLTIEEEVKLKESLALQEKPSSEKKALFKVPDTFLKGLLSHQLETGLHVPSTTLQPGTSKYSAAIISSVGKFSTASKTSACESSSNKPFSSQGEKSREEEEFILKKYMTRQTDISSDMRAILVDWLVEVQMTFEVSHETLYLAVKLVDHYLMGAICRKEKLQLLGSTAFLIAAKFEEPIPPCLDDFLYICNDIYQREEMLSMEMRILKALNFDINIPTAYHFLRRYARCVHASMQTLTLARFICEMTLQEYDYVQERASRLAAGCLLLALHMRKLGKWVPILEYYSGYKTSDLRLLVRHLNILLTWRCGSRLNTVRTKYSHQVFFEVTKIPPLDTLKLEEIMNNG